MATQTATAGAPSTVATASNYQQYVNPRWVTLLNLLGMPVSAVLMTDRIYHSFYSSLKRAIVHTSTFSENSLSMRAGLATLDVLENEDLGARALYLGEPSAPSCARRWPPSRWPRRSAAWAS